MWEGIVSRTQAETQNGDDLATHRETLLLQAGARCWALLGARPLAAVPHGHGENGGLGSMVKP